MFFISKSEPKNVKEALKDEYWINSIQEELGQFKRNKGWELVPRTLATFLVPSGSIKTSLRRMRML